MARYLLSARNRVVWKRVMQMKMKKRIALLLAAAMLSLILCGCADDAETVGAVRSDGSVSDALATGLGVTVPEDETGRFASADGIHADVDYADMTWYIYDDAELLDKAARLGETADGKEAADLYDWLMAEYAKVYTLDNLAYIDFYAHPGDETLSDACRQLDSVLNEVNDALCTALSDALDGPAGSALRSYIGEDKATALVGYDEQTDRQREITERVSELTLQYNALIMEYLSYDEETEKIGALYRELVDLHNEEAQIVGYKDYADYAYEASYGRDFTPDDAAALCEAVKPYARQYFGSLYYNEATYADSPRTPTLPSGSSSGSSRSICPASRTTRPKRRRIWKSTGCTSWTALTASAISASPRRSTSIMPPSSISRSMATRTTSRVCSTSSAIITTPM